MRTTGQNGSRREALNIRIKPEVRELIDQAARLPGRNRTDFILDSARRAAEEALLERTLVMLDPKAYRRFLERLDAPPQPNERLIGTMQTPPPWD